MIAKCFRHIAVVALIALAAAVGGCAAASTPNNHMSCWDFTQHLRRCGLPVESYQPLVATYAGAREGAAIKFANVKNEIGVYRFDIKREDDRKRLEMFENDQCMYVGGQKFAILINGSFVVIGHDKNPLKNKIIEAVKSF